MLFRDSRKIARGRSFSEERCCPCGCACQRCEKEFASRPESHPYTSSKSQKTRRYCLNAVSYTHLDVYKRQELYRWPLKPAESPTGLSMDLVHRRLFAGCEGKLMPVIDADNGKIVSVAAIGDAVDATAFDPASQLAFASNGEGILTVVHEDSPGKYSVVENVPTKKSARTMGLDLQTHNVFLPAADFDPPAPGERRGKMKPGSFVILVVGK